MLGTAGTSVGDANRQHGHLFDVDMSRPTKGLRLNFAYGGCGIRPGNVLDHMASSGQPGLTRLPPLAPSPSTSLRFDSWILRKVGAAFVRGREREVAHESASA